MKAKNHPKNFFKNYTIKYLSKSPYIANKKILNFLKQFEQ